MTGQFYDKVTRKFGTFQGAPRPLTTYPQGNPEEMFEQKLFELSGKDKVTLDLVFLPKGFADFQNLCFLFCSPKLCFPS